MALRTCRAGRGTDRVKDLVAWALLACLWVILRRVTLAYNCASWEREWGEVAPIWSRGEGKRG